MLRKKYITELEDDYLLLLEDAYKSSITASGHKKEEIENLYMAVAYDEKYGWSSLSNYTKEQLDKMNNDNKVILGIFPRVDILNLFTKEQIDNLVESALIISNNSEYIEKYYQLKKELPLRKVIFEMSPVVNKFNLEDMLKKLYISITKTEKIKEVYDFYYKDFKEIETWLK